MNALARVPLGVLMTRDPRMYRTIQGQTRNINVALPTLPGNLMIVPIRKNVWGPLLWKTFHGFGRILKGIVITEERVRLTKGIFQFTGTLIGTIPCPSCRNHAKDYYMKNGISDKDIEESCAVYEDWAFNFHNIVNSRLGKGQFRKEEMFEIYNDWSPEIYIDEYLRAINSVTRLNFNDKSVRAAAGGLLTELSTTIARSQEIIKNTIEMMTNYGVEMNKGETCEINNENVVINEGDDTNEGEECKNKNETEEGQIEIGEAIDEYDPSEYSMPEGVEGSDK